jgi:hypothetical protein
VHAEYPELLGEMYAYSIAAAHLKLPHTNLENYMTSDVGSWAEGWPFVDQMNSERFCNTDLSQTDYTLPVRTQFDPFVYEPAGFTTGGPVYIRCKPSTLDFSSLTHRIYMLGLFWCGRPSCTTASGTRRPTASSSSGSATSATRRRCVLQIK